MVKLSKTKKMIRGGMPLEKDIPCREITTLSGHGDKVYQVAFHPKFPLVATCSQDETAKLWRVNPNGSVHETPVATLRGHSDSVQSVTFHPTLPLLATGSTDRTTKLWRFSPDGSTATPAATFRGQLEPVYSVAFHPMAPFLAISSHGKYKRSVKLWRFTPDGSAANLWRVEPWGEAEEIPVATLRGRSEPIGAVWSLAFHPTLPLLASGSQNKTAMLWRVNPDGSSATHTATLSGHSGVVNSVAFHPIMHLVATSSLDNTAMLWRFRPDGSADKIPVAILTGHDASVSSVAFHPTLPLLATGSQDGTAKLWHLNLDGSAATPVATLRGHMDSVTSVAFHPMLPVLATGSEDYTVKLWDLSKIFEYQRRIAITRTGLTSRLIKAFTTQNLESRADLRFSNAAQGRIGNPPNMKYNTMENRARRDEILRKKYLDLGQRKAVSLLPMLASQPVLPSNVAAAAVEFPSVSSVCRPDDTDCNAVYDSNFWDIVKEIHKSCSDSSVILKKIEELKGYRALLEKQRKLPGITSIWIRKLEEKISHCSL